MSIKSIGFAAAAAALTAMPALAEGIMVNDPYARASSMKSSSGAAFMMIMNHSGQDDRLVGVRSDIAKRTELHTHVESDNGVMKMMHVKEGFDLPKDGMLKLQRGGHHVMFMGLEQPLADGDKVSITLEFEKSGEMAVEIPVDLKRKPMHGKMDHSKMDHSNMQMSN